VGGRRAPRAAPKECCGPPSCPATYTSLAGAAVLPPPCAKHALAKALCVRGARKALLARLRDLRRAPRLPAGGAPGGGVPPDGRAAREAALRVHKLGDGHAAEAVAGAGGLAGGGGKAGVVRGRETGRVRWERAAGPLRGGEGARFAGAGLEGGRAFSARGRAEWSSRAAAAAAAAAAPPPLC
jgi:hypothetical protein